MTKTDYMNELSRRLAKRLSARELQDALAFYNEYFDEAGPTKEQEVIAELGTPAQVASQVLSERAIAAADEQPQSVKKGLSAVWIVILSLFAAPVALPIAIAVVAVMFSLVVAILAIIISFLATLFAFAVAGIVFVAVGLVVIFQKFMTGIFYIGAGLIGLGITLIFAPAVMWAASSSFRALAGLFNKVVDWFNKKFIAKRQSYAAPTTPSPATPTTPTMAIAEDSVLATQEESASSEEISS